MFFFLLVEENSPTAFLEHYNIVERHYFNGTGQTKPNGGVFVMNCVARVRNRPRRAKNKNEIYAFSRRLSRARRLL